MNLFTNPIHLVPLLERAVEALETIAAELVTARMDRRQHMTLADMDDDATDPEAYDRLVRAVREDHDARAYDPEGVHADCPPDRCLHDDEATATESDEEGRKRTAHPVGTVFGCPVCDLWRFRMSMTVDEARVRHMEDELPQCSGGAS